MKRNGFSLLELIICLVIISILIFLINNIILVNFKISDESYKSEMEFKESTSCMLYIENIIRRADKIEKTNNESNFTAYIKDNKTYSSYRFELENNTLYVRINNLENDGDRESKTPIGKCQNARIVYKEDEGFDISINFIENEGISSYKTFIGE